MSYEQRYKDALDRAKKLKETCRGTAVIGWCEYIFPELKESEDEKIRKDLIKWCEEFPDLIWRGHDKNKVLAWLKKQGEQKPADKVEPIVVRDFNSVFSREQVEEIAKRYDEVIAMAKECITHIPDEAVNKYMLNMFPELKESEDEAIRESLINYLKERKSCESYGQYVLRYDHWITWLEKQGEQKPADKVEPKFKAGDWVVLTAGELSTTLQIANVDINKKRYWFNEGSYLPIVDEEGLHLWTIKDAKDGDVLCLGDVIAIFKKYIGQEECICYCSFCDNCYCSSCDNGGFEIPIENGEDNVYGCTGTAPATKEQRDLLFQKMKESGYEWDANKKELKKL